MRRFLGRGGCVYALGSRYDFTNIHLEDCGDGWDWRAPEGLRYWLPEGLRFEVRDGGWHGIGAVEVHHRSGRVGFGRCLSGMDVRASGTCYPSSLLAEGEEWELIVETLTAAAPQLGEENRVATVVLDAYAEIKGVRLDPPIDSVLAWLPFSVGAFVGPGKLRQSPVGVSVKFDEEGVQYVAR